MVQMGGCGKRSPFSRTEEISLAGIPSYGLDPNVISSQTVTPAGWKEKIVKETAKSWTAQPGCGEVVRREGSPGSTVLPESQPEKAISAMIL